MGVQPHLMKPKSLAWASDLLVHRSKEKKMKKHLTSTFLALVFLAGIAMILYPTVSDYVNSLHQSRAISTYAESVEKLDPQQYESYWFNAQEYNSTLKARANRFRLTDEEIDEYNQLLNVDGHGEMGYIEIPSIQVFASHLPRDRRVGITDCDWTSGMDQSAGWWREHTLCAIRPSRASQRKAVHKPGQACDWRYIYAACAG